MTTAMHTMNGSTPIHTSVMVLCLAGSLALSASSRVDVLTYSVHHVQVDALGRADEGGLDQQHDDDAEPDQIDAGLLQSQPSQVPKLSPRSRGAIPRQNVPSTPIVTMKHRASRIPRTNPAM